MSRVISLSTRSKLRERYVHKLLVSTSSTSKKTDNPIKSIQPLLKILKHSTDPSASNSSSNPSPVDAVGLLLGLDLSGVAEIVDSYPLPGGVQGALNAVGSGADSEKSEQDVSAFQ